MAKKVRETISILEAHGWREVRRRGGHRHFKHAERASVVTVAGKPSATIPVGTLNEIRRKSGIRELR
ncbi:MAG TPA: type II toxin-antitoxin system HicA family toxin [Solirubrobacteraceae bacterium]